MKTKYKELVNNEKEHYEFSDFEIVSPSVCSRAVYDNAQ